MARALMVSSSFLPGRGGIESYLAELCSEVAPHLAVLAPHRRDGQPLPKDLPYDVAGSRSPMVVPTPRIAAAIRAEARTGGVDRILFGTPWPLVLLGPKLKASGLSYSVIIHGAEMLVPSVIPGIRSRLATALSEADLLLTVSEYTRTKTVSFLERAQRPVPPTDVLRARVDLERFNPDRTTPALKERLGLTVEQPMVLCLGRLVPRKGVDRLIRVADRIAKRVPGTTFVVAGTGPEERRLKRKASEIRTRVVFTGRVSDEEAPALYATSDVFALPVVSRWWGLDVEGLGVVLLEASASGTPCVTGRSGGTPEAVIDGDTGFVVDADDEDALVGAIVRLLEDAEEASRMGRAGRSFVAERFSNRRLPSSLLDWLGVAALPTKADEARQEEGGWN